jgi:hypothetical protein
MPSYYTIEEFSERRSLRDKLLNAIDTKALGYEDYVKAMEDLNKKMKEEALKLQKQNGEPVPTL